MKPSDEDAAAAVGTEAPPRGSAKGLATHWKKDLVSGFLVSLIALPLCLAIAQASGYPPVAGIFTAVVGGVLAPFVSNSELTIKGPAAGLIVIAVGCIADFGGSGFGDGVWSAADQDAYRLALGVGVAAAALQVLFGVGRGGILGEFFPISAVHGMLAAIGVIIIAKQVPVALGVSSAGKPLDLLLKIPDEVVHMNPAIGLIGLTSLAIMLLWPLVGNKHLRKIPAAVVVLSFAVPLGRYIHLEGQPHSYSFAGHVFELGPKFLVSVPGSVMSAITTPDLSGLMSSRGWYWAAMFAIIGTLESLLSARAVDLIDPWQRRTNLDRDNTAVGAGNLASAFAGGLPMISEIVRSRANIDNGARTRFANLFHALFLLVFVALLPSVISLIPLSALGAMLVYTGFRLAHPREFIHVYKVGVDEFLVFTATVVGVLATDLLIGIGIGIGVEILLALIGGAPLRSLFRPDAEVVSGPDGRRVLTVRQAAVFTGWIALRRRIEATLASGVNTLTIDLSQARLVDHTVMQKLHELRTSCAQRAQTLEIAGLDNHRAISSHPFAARRRAKAA